MSCDFSLIIDPDFLSSRYWHEARAFEEEMKERSYGSDALNQAWLFFKTGYQAGWLHAGGADE